MGNKAEWQAMARREDQWGTLVANVIEGSDKTVKQIVPVLVEETWGPACMSAVLFGLPILSKRAAGNALDTLDTVSTEELLEAFELWESYGQPLHERHRAILDRVEEARSRAAAPVSTGSKPPDSWFRAGHSRYFDEPITGDGPEALRERLQQVQDLRRGWVAAWGATFPIDVGPLPEAAPSRDGCTALHGAVMRAGARGSEVADAIHLLGALIERGAVDLPGLGAEVARIEGAPTRTPVPGRLRRFSTELDWVVDVALDGCPGGGEEALLLGISRSPGRAGQVLRAYGGLPDRYRDETVEAFAGHRRETDALLLAHDVHGRYRVAADRFVAPLVRDVDDVGRDLLEPIDRLIVSIRAGYVKLPDLAEDWRATYHHALPQLCGNTLVSTLFAIHDRVRVGFNDRTADRLDAVFRKLYIEYDAVAKKGFGRTQSEAWTLAVSLGQGWPRFSKCVVFFTEQDLAGAVRGDGLRLAFGVVDGTDADNEAWGRSIVAELAMEGIETEWDGTAKRRIAIPPFKWERFGHPVSCAGLSGTKSSP